MTDGCLGTDTVVDFVEGRADDAQRERIARHASRCDACRELLSSLARETPREVRAATPAAPPVAIGRYRVHRLVGAGGMGIVYAAYDPELERTVAVKLLNGRSDGALQTRLKREAQAMAQVVHPNVMPVHDVGEIDGRIFVVMELVAGETLAAYATPERTTAEILRSYREAGAGLAAVHAAGIVHRDFKPENVLRARDGRVLVADFGLAQSRGGPALASGDGASPVSPEGPTLAAGLTVTGVVVGTPFYMAPELHAGAEADARSDQFSFCVALFVALHGARPFAGDTLDELRANVDAGRLREPPTTRRIPRRIRAALRRGLATDPAARFPSMPALLTALAPPARRWLWVAAAITVAAIAAGAYLLGAPAPPCRGVAARADGAWGPDRAATVSRALAATDAPFAAATARAAIATLDAYARDWRAMRQDACEATRVRGEQTDGVLELRMACLDQRLQALAAAADTLAAADRSVAARAVAVALHLPAIPDCADVAALASPVHPPTAAAKAEVARLRGQLAGLATQRDAGRYLPALAAAHALEPAVAAVDYRPLEGELYALIGELARERQDYRAARGALDRAVLASEAGRDDRLTAASLIAAIEVVGHGLAEVAAAAALRDRARALLERLDHPPALEAALAQAVGGVAVDAADFPTAERELHAALAAWERIAGPDDLRVVPALHQLAYFELHRTRLDAARAMLVRARAIQERVLGPTHPDFAETLIRLGDVDSADSKYAEADALYARAQEIEERALGPESPALAGVLLDRGNVADWQGDQARAIDLERRAIAMDLRTLGPDHRTTLVHQVTLASTLESASRFADARAALAEVLPRLRALLGPDHQLLAYALETAANIELGLADYAAARDHAREAMAMYARVIGATYVPWEEQRTLGEALLGLGDPGAAADVLEPARAKMPADQDPGVVARLDSDLGRALVMARRDVPRGTALARAAWQHMATDDRMEYERKVLAAWFAAQQIRPVAR